MPSYPDCCDFHRETKDMFLRMKCTNRTDGEKEAAALRDQLAAERHDKEVVVLSNQQLREQLAAERERTEQFARAQAKANARLCEIEGEHNAALAAEKAAHCKDCCCARSWEALGDFVKGVGSIPEHIAALREQLADEREKYERSQEKLKAALVLLRHAKDSISTEDHVKMGLFLVRIRDSQITEIAAIWKESDT